MRSPHTEINASVNKSFSSFSYVCEINEEIEKDYIKVKKARQTSDYRTVKILCSLEDGHNLFIVFFLILRVHFLDLGTVKEGRA